MEIYTITDDSGKICSGSFMFETKKEAENYIKENPKIFKDKNVKPTAINSIYKDGNRYPILDFDKANGRVKLAPFSIPYDAEINSEENK